MYKIVHLDAGRKYISPENIRALIDKMAALGYNQLGLYLGDNQGFRLMLEETGFTAANGQHYDLIGNGIVNSGMVTGDQWQPDHFRPSQEYHQGKKYYLTQEEMTGIIQYARDLGITVSPAINMPGHMGGILMNLKEAFRVTYRGKRTLSTLDVTNEAAVAFALALLDKYCAYFSAQGIRSMSIGADEYAYDCGASLDGLDEGLKQAVRDFMNRCAGVIKGWGMVPRAFNDFFEPGCGLDKDFEVYYWNGSNVNEVIADGYTKIINTSDSCYYALGSGWYTEAQTCKGTSEFSPQVISTYAVGRSVMTVPPVGVCMSIWCDRGFYGEDFNAPIAADAGTSLIQNEALNLGLAQFAARM